MMGPEPGEDERKLKNFHHHQPDSGKEREK
jgi:hypothetical protein